MARKQKQLNTSQGLNDFNVKYKLEAAFSSSNTLVYKREKEIALIENFLKSKKQILNIVGVPGSGKTSCVLSICENLTGFKYFNFYNEANIKREILKNKYKIIVIDEFDKFHQFKPNDSKFVIHHITTQGAKLITLGNNLESEGDKLVFKPYTSTEIEDIVKLKIDNEIGHTILSDLDLKLICRKNNNGGDMRCIFKYILNNFDCTTNTVNVQLSVEKSIDIKPIEDNDVSIHHKLILKVGKHAGNKLQAFKKYFKECEEYNIPPLSRLVFFELFDVLWYK